MSALEIAAAVGLGWSVFAALAWVAVRPLLQAASRADALAEPVAAELLSCSTSEGEGSPDTPPSPLRVVAGEHPALPSLRQSGYLGLVLERLAIHGCSIFGAEEVCVFVRDPRSADEALVPAVGAGLRSDLIGRRFPIDGGPMGAALASGGPTVLLDQPWPGWLAEHDAAGGRRRAAVTPVWVGGGVQGALSVAHRGGGRAYGVSELALLGELAQLVGHALGQQAQRALSASDPQAEIEGLIQTLARIEPETDSHSADVAEMTRRFADELALPACDRLELELGARLHDVGKLRLPPHILRKRGSLSQGEWEVVRLHPVWGAEMLAPIPGLEAVALIVRFHHERWDGGGYPDGLAGEQIPLASRIIAICDAFSAMTSDRPYRRALDPAAALRELDASAGTQFDPGLTALFARSVCGAEVGYSVGAREAAAA